MPRLPRISSREAIRALERLGFEQVRQTGSHVVMKKETPDGVERLTGRLVRSFTPAFCLDTVVMDADIRRT